MVNWQFLFSNKSVLEQVSIFNNTLMNIFSSYIPNTFLTIDDKNLPCIIVKIKNKTIHGNSVCKSYISNGKTTIDYQKLHNIGNEISQIITNSKKEF